MCSDVSLFIDGSWTKAVAGRTIPVVNPATVEHIGTVAHADKSDLDRALEASDKGFRAWRKVSAFDRSKIMRKAANLPRDRADAIAPLLTREQGKPLPRSQGRDFGRGRCHRLVCRGGAPHLRAGDPGARRRRL
jgi:succinate-semialdehyde dehydrogenase / glutarate-semialdehyde dehydrogenase